MQTPSQSRSWLYKSALQIWIIGGNILCSSWNWSTLLSSIINWGELCHMCCVNTQTCFHCADWGFFEQTDIHLQAPHTEQSEVCSLFTVKGNESTLSDFIKSFIFTTGGTGEWRTMLEVCRLSYSAMIHSRLLTNCIRPEPQLNLAKNHLLIQEETVRKRGCKAINQFVWFLCVVEGRVYLK